MKKATPIIVVTLFAALMTALVTGVFAQAVGGIYGSPVRTGKQLDIQTPTLNTAENTTPAIEFGGASTGQVIVPTGSSITSLTYYAGYSTSVAFLPLYTNAGTPVAVSQTVSGGHVYDLPDAVRGARYLKIVVNASGAVTIICKG